MLLQSSLQHHVGVAAAGWDLVMDGYFGGGCLGFNTGLYLKYVARGVQICVALSCIFTYSIIPINLHLL